MILKKIAVLLILASFSFVAGAEDKAPMQKVAVEKSPQKKPVKEKSTTVKTTETPRKVVTKSPAPVKSKASGWSKDDPDCKVVGGRHLCSRACNKDETGPSGKACKTKQDTGTSKDYCDCGTKTSGPAAIMNTAIQKQ